VTPEQLKSLIDQRDLHALRDWVLSRPAVETAEIFGALTDEERVLIFRILPRDLAADIFALLDVDLQKSLLSALGDKQIAALLNEMAADDRTALFEEFPAEAARQLVTLLSKEEREVALALLGYGENSVGRLMSPDYIRIQQEWNVREVLDHIRAFGRESDSFDTLYVTDARGKLVDEIGINQILLASPDTPIDSLMNFTSESLDAHSDQETAVDLFRKYDRGTLPVVDTEGILLGIVTVDDILDVQVEEVTEDIQKLGGSEALEDPYIRTPVSTLIKKRASWLVVLFLGEMLTASAMAAFEDEIKRAVVLALFVPLIISSGGNSGSQTSTLIIRALAVGEIKISDWLRVFKREVVAGVVLGTLLGAAGFLRIAAWSQFSPVYGPHWLSVACTVFFALIGVVTMGSVAGSMLPFALKKCRLDPATSSAPMVATLVDVAGVFLYFWVALVLLSGKLL
jgi:magnesium transporter